MAVIKTSSHRSRSTLLSLLPNLGREHYTRGRKGTLNGYYIVADEDVATAASITGVVEIKRPLNLRPCIAA